MDSDKLDDSDEQYRSASIASSVRTKGQSITDVNVECRSSWTIAELQREDIMERKLEKKGEVRKERMVAEEVEAAIRGKITATSKRMQTVFRNALKQFSEEVEEKKIRTMTTLPGIEETFSKKRGMFKDLSVGEYQPQRGFAKVDIDIFTGKNISELPAAHKSGIQQEQMWLDENMSSATVKEAWTGISDCKNTDTREPLPVEFCHAILEGTRRTTTALPSIEEAFSRQCRDFLSSQKAENEMLSYKVFYLKKVNITNIGQSQRLDNPYISKQLSAGTLGLDETESDNVGTCTEKIHSELAFEMSTAAYSGPETETGPEWETDISDGAVQLGLAPEMSTLPFSGPEWEFYTSDEVARLELPCEMRSAIHSGLKWETSTSIEVIHSELAFETSTAAYSEQETGMSTVDHSGPKSGTSTAVHSRIKPGISTAAHSGMRADMSAAATSGSDASARDGTRHPILLKRKLVEEAGSKSARKGS